MPVVATLGMSLAVFLLIPLAQWVEGKGAPKPHVDTETEGLPPPKDIILQEPRSEKTEPEQESAPPMPMIDDIIAQLTPIGIEWNVWIPGGDIMMESLIPKDDLSDILMSSMLDREPRAIRTARPNYTSAMRHLTGRVIVMAVVDEKGNVTNVSIHRGASPELNRISMEAARKWTFEGGTKNGVARRFKVMIPFDYGNK
jgi:TonB family protein